MAVAQSGVDYAPCADLFCGAGGFSEGCEAAAAALGIEMKLVAINHWKVAISTHTENHAGVEHYCEDLAVLDPRKAVPGGYLRLLMASPECTHHSNARGGKPMSDQSRATAWHILRWAEALYIEDVIVENVREFMDWGPLGRNGRPIQSQKGRLFRQFLSSLRALGYAVDYRILNAADYGDATTRKRLFIRARKGRRKIVWPEPTHQQRGEHVADLFGAKPWRPARDIIDWTLPGESIYSRKRPLSPNTMRRIMAGLEKYSGLPFLTPVNHGPESRRSHSVNEPMPTITAFDAMGLTRPFLVILRNHADARSIEDPLPTLTAAGQHVGLAEPFLVKSYLGSDAASLDVPLPTITASVEHLALAQPVVVNMKGKSIGRSINDPAPTITAGARHLAVAEPYIVPQFGGRPGQRPRTHSLGEPLPTITGHGAGAVVQPYLVKYHGADKGAHSIDDPLGTITGKDRFALVDPEFVRDIDGEIIGWLDIRFRMLQPNELAAAMSFPKNYRFAGNRADQVKQIGNAVPVGLATALCMSALA